MKFKIGRKTILLSEGTYSAVITSIKKITNFKRPALEFIFEIVEGEYKGVELRGFCNADYEVFSSNTKLYKWYEKATGQSLEPSDDLDADDFLNRVLKVKIENKKSKKTGNDFSNVTEILGVVREI